MRGSEDGLLMEVVFKSGLTILKTDGNFGNRGIILQLFFLAVDNKKTLSALSEALKKDDSPLRYVNLRLKVNHYKILLKIKIFAFYIFKDQED